MAAEKSYSVEYAKSGMAACQNCHDLINAGSVRFGTLVRKFGNKKWRHLRCVTQKVWGRALEEAGGSVEGLEGFDYLEPQDQERVRLAVAGEELPVSEPEGLTSSEEEEADDADDEDYDPRKREGAKKTKKAAAPKTPGKKRGAVGGEEGQPRAKKRSQMAPTKAKGKMVTVEEQIGAEEEGFEGY